MTPTVLKEEILVELGAQFLQVEIKDEGLSLAIKKTLEFYSQHFPNIRHEAYRTVAGTTQSITFHECPEDVIGVTKIEVMPVNASMINSGLAIENQYLSGYPVFYGVGDTAYDVEYWTIRKMWIKTIGRALASDPDYDFIRDPITGRFTICTFGSVHLYVDAKTAIPHDPQLRTIPYHHHNWFREWAVTEAKLFVAGVRDKFDAVPIAGGMSRMDGSRLKAEAITKQRELADRIMAMRADLFPVYS